VYVKLARKINFPLLSFRLLKTTLTPLQVEVEINLTKKVDVDLLRQRQRRKRRNVIPPWMKHAVY
jgi:hypothetical protein